jgi:hypothetical protein
MFKFARVIAISNKFHINHILITINLNLKM